MSTRTAHLLTHHLLERTVRTWHLESSLWLLGFLFFVSSLHRLIIRLTESAFLVRLPLSIVQDTECLGLRKNLLTATIEQVDHVVDFDSLVEHARHHKATIWRPLDADSAVRASLADLLHAVERPEVDLALEVAKATD